VTDRMRGQVARGSRGGCMRALALRFAPGHAFGTSATLERHRQWRFTAGCGRCRVVTALRTDGRRPWVGVTTCRRRA
jgi:hypothetical protein